MSFKTVMNRFRKSRASCNEESQRMSVKTVTLSEASPIVVALSKVDISVVHEDGTEQDFGDYCDDFLTWIKDQEETPCNSSTEEKV